MHLPPLLFLCSNPLHLTTWETKAKATLTAHSAPLADRVSSELPDLDKYKSYDKAFVHHATDLIAQADIILAHCKDESIQVEVRADRDLVELSRREWPDNGVVTQVFTYVQDGADLSELPPEYVKALAGYVLLLEGIGYATACARQL